MPHVLKYFLILLDDAFNKGLNLLQSSIRGADTLECIDHNLGRKLAESLQEFTSHVVSLVMHEIRQFLLDFIELLLAI